MDAYATHIEVLAAAVLRTTGPILELGTGEYSTPLLRVLRGDRPLLSLESDAEWLERFRSMECQGHAIRLVTDWDAVDVAQYWGLVVLDHAPAHRRIIEGRRVAAWADIVVVHDTEAACYDWSRLWSQFDWVFTFTKHPNWTSLAGRGTPPDWMAGLLIPGEFGIPRSR